MTHKDKVAIVTGAGQGIGLEICKYLAKEGAHVFLNDIDPLLAQQAAHEVSKETPGSCTAVPASALARGVDEAYPGTCGFRN